MGLSQNWTKSDLSGEDNCVEARALPDGGVAVRDSKNPGGTTFTFSAAEWEAFLGGVRLGTFDLE